MNAFREPIYVTRPLFPPLSDYTARLREVWDARWLTNGGKQHQALAEAVRKQLGVERLNLICNGTVALSIAARAMGWTEGEVITTPFTFAATPQSLSWIGLDPVFADIDSERLTLSPEAVEAAITPRTRGILAVHVLGIPCDVEGLAAVAKRHKLGLLYDGAHVFGAEWKGRAIGTYGDGTMYSFHATKLFNTAEGGALTFTDPTVHDRAEQLKNFCFVGEEEVGGVGTNGKMNELQAAMGLSVLEVMDGERRERERVDRVYREALAGIPGIVPTRWSPEVTRRSLQYFAVRVKAGNTA